MSDTVIEIMILVGVILIPVESLQNLDWGPTEEGV